MQTDSTAQSVLFPELFERPVVVRFDLPHASSDGGALLLKVIDRRLWLTEGLARAVADRRQRGKITHELKELLAQRIFGIACGYPDANDAGRLAEDPIHKMLLDRDPVRGDALASQPTLSRFENALGACDLYRMGETLAELILAHHRDRLGRRVRRIAVDLDITADPTHGVQQLTFFNGHYDTFCYLPLLLFVRFNDEPEQHLLTAVLRPGNAPDKRGVLSLLRRVLPKLRALFPKARLLVRLDGGFACPEILDFLDDQLRLDYVCGLAKNTRLKRLATRWMRQARRRSRRSGRTEHLYDDVLYAAKKWPLPRRVIVKAEVVRYPGRPPKDNPRFLVTNLRQGPQWVYEQIYCHRGEIENRIKELQLGLQIDRTSCSRFLANQFRVLLTVAAYALLEELRRCARGTSCARAQVWTLRERLLKVAAQVVASVRRIVLHLPASFPFQDSWCRIAGSLGARAG